LAGGYHPYVTPALTLEGWRVRLTPPTAALLDGLCCRLLLCAHNHSLIFGLHAKRTLHANIV
jgi:hypothetical protein